MVCKNCTIMVCTKLPECTPCVGSIYPRLAVPDMNSRVTCSIKYDFYKLGAAARLPH